MDFKIARAILKNEIDKYAQKSDECVNNRDDNGMNECLNIIDALEFAIDEMEQNEEFRNAMKGIMN